jgi:hypothetical protein
MPGVDIPVAPYSRAGLFVASGTDTGSAVFDDLVVHVGDVYARSPSPRDADATSE